MAALITGGFDTFEAAMFGRPHPNTLQFLQQQFEPLTTSLSNAASQFMETSKAMFERVSSSDAMRLARAAVHRVSSMWLSDEIQPLLELARLQHAPPTMQRWIMAETHIRSLYLKQACDGYSDSYVNVHGNDIGEAHYDWRRIQDGIIDVDGNPEADAWTSTTYIDELYDGDRELELEEQVDIINTHDSLRYEAIHNRVDPTSKYNANL